MFGVRSRSVGPTSRANGTEGEEPSSPKVTCIGQVRIKAGKKNKKKQPKPKPKLKPGLNCRCLRRALFCSSIFNRKKKKGMMPRRLWLCCATSGCCEQSFGSKKKEEMVKEGDQVVAVGLGNIRESMVRSEVRQQDEEAARLSNFTDEPGWFSNYNEELARTSNYARRSFSGREEASDRDEEEERKEEREDGKVFVSSATTTPPKNALLLMRCRSAPQHHNRFAPSPVAAGLVDQKMEVVRVKEIENRMGMILEKKETEEEKRAESQKRNGGEEEDEEDEEEEEEEEEMRCSSARPLVLTRCKSEPARKGEEIMAPAGPEMASTSCFWAHTVSGSRQRTHSPLPSH